MKHKKCKICNNWLNSSDGYKYCRECKELGPGNPGWYTIRFRILKRDKFKCTYCGRNPEEHGVVLHIDHLCPKSCNGKWEENNLVAACLECNLGKSDVLLDEKERREILLRKKSDWL